MFDFIILFHACDHLPGLQKPSAVMRSCLSLVRSPGPVA
jgi:hypothetical protein